MFRLSGTSSSRCILSIQAVVQLIWCPWLYCKHMYSVLTLHVPLTYSFETKCIHAGGFMLIIFFLYFVICSYDDTFSPVVKPTTVRLLLTLAVTKGWSFRQLDIQNAILEEEVFTIYAPATWLWGSETPSPCLPINQVHLRPKTSTSRLTNSQSAYGVKASKADTSLFIYRDSATVMFLLVYVDDIIVICSSAPVIQQLVWEYVVKDLGSSKLFSWNRSASSEPRTCSYSTEVRSWHSCPSRYAEV